MAVIIIASQFTNIHNRCSLSRIKPELPSRKYANFIYNYLIDSSPGLRNPLVQIPNRILDDLATLAA
jgi:hypothetical protein